MVKTILEALQWATIPKLEAGEGRLLPATFDAEGEAASSFSPVYDGPPSHSFLELMWLIEGTTHMEIDGQAFTLQPGDFCLLSPGVLHAEMYGVRTPPYKSLWFQQRNGRLSGLLFAYDPIGRGQIIDHMTSVAPPSIESLLSALHHEMLSPSTAERDAVCRPLLLVLARLFHNTLRQAKERGELSANDAAQRAQLFMEEHYARPIALADVARAAYVSPNHLATVFKRATGQTVMHALTEIRLRHARHLLLERHGTLAQVARACGFGSTENFSRVFRRVVGMPPGRYGK